MKIQTHPRSLHWNLLLIVALKIAFLCALWQLVLKREAVHVDAIGMTEQLLSPRPFK